MTEYSPDAFHAGLARLPERRAVPVRPSRTFTESVVIAGSLLLADLLAAVSAFGIAFLLAGVVREMVGYAPRSFFDFVTDRGPLLELMLVLMISVFAFGRLYSRVIWEVEEIKGIFLATGLLALFHGGYQLIISDHGARVWFALTWPFLALLSVIFRRIARGIGPVNRALASHVLLAGSGITAEDFAFQLRETQGNPVRVLQSVPVAEIAGLSAAELGDFVAARARAEGLPPARIQVVLAADDAERPACRLLAERLWIAGIPYSFAMPLDVQARRGLQTRVITGLDMVLAEHERPALTLPERMVKRGSDVLVALVLLALLALPMLVVALLLLREGGGVFFYQLRVGRDGRRFRCVKFRSMRPDAEKALRRLLDADPVARAEWAQYQKLSHDPRITALGHFLRTTSLDELPQIFNVLRGDMSLIGPRPIVAPEVPGYENDHDYFNSPDFSWYASCRPGISGLWQVSGRATTSYDERKRLDRWYVRNWSIWLDIAILIRTLRVVVLGRTAS